MVIKIQLQQKLSFKARQAFLLIHKRYQEAYSMEYFFSILDKKINKLHELLQLLTNSFIFWNRCMIVSMSKIYANSPKNQTTHILNICKFQRAKLIKLFLSYYIYTQKLYSYYLSVKEYSIHIALSNSTQDLQI